VADVAVIIVSYNASADLDNCLRSLHDAPPRTSHEIVVVDNASHDGSADMVRTRWPGVRLIELPRNIGFAAANNQGIRRTSGELILLLNSDTLVPDGAIDRLIQTFHELPGATIAGPRLISGHGKPELSFGRMIGPLAELRQKTIVRLASARRIAAMTSRTRTVDWVSGACLLVRRADAEAVGLLDERYFMYCEDVDFCAAVRSRGGRVYFTPAADIVHLRGRSGQSNPRATEDAYRESQLAFYRKHHPRWAPLLKGYLWMRGKLPG
jgi:GT2 family glycosyltransferase